MKVREEIQLDRAALIGCGDTTGLGAALTVQYDEGVPASLDMTGLGAVFGVQIPAAGETTR